MSISRSVSLKVGLLIAAAVACLPAEAADDIIVATIDQAKLVKVPAGASTLIIGNPAIADVTQLMPNLMVLTPKAFGETNFMALDRNGDIVAGSMIQVVNGTNAMVVQRGMERESYSCAPRCQPTERLGDSDKYLSQVASQAQDHFKRLTTSTPPVAPPLNGTRQGADTTVATAQAKNSPLAAIGGMKPPL